MLPISPSSDGTGPRRGVAILGIAANARFAGLALTIDTETVYLRVARLAGIQVGVSRILSLISPVLCRFRPVAAVLLIDEAEGERRARAFHILRDAIHPALTTLSLPVIEVSKFDLARDLGLSRCTTVALRRELLRRIPLPSLLGRSKITDAREKERYWECAVLASGATRVPLRQSGVVHA